MNHAEKHREFSMKYCNGLDDHVVVMKTEQGGIQNTLCLSSHLCHADERKTCGQGDGKIYGTADASYVKM